MRRNSANLAVALICACLSVASGVARATGSEPGKDVQADPGPCNAAVAAADDDRIVEACGALIDNEKHQEALSQMARALAAQSQAERGDG